MTMTPSTMLPLGTQAPDFNLLDTNTQQKINLTTLKSNKATLIAFICNHCPFVIHIQDQLIQYTQDYQAKGVSFIAISSNDVDNYPEDAPDKMATKNFPFPYLYDDTQAVAKAYHAACTPDFYLFDGDLALVYRGQFDSSRPGNDVSVTGEDLRRATDQLLAGDAIFADQKPSIGCNIKWK